MKPLSRYSACLFLLGTLSAQQAWATDIRCASTQQAAERVICDHAILDNEYDDIYRQQQALIASGRLSADALGRWQQTRNTCVDVHCIDQTFAQWRAMDKALSALPAGTSPVAAGRSAPDSPASSVMPSPTPLAAAQIASAASVPTVQRGSATGLSLPAAVDVPASATPATPASTAIDAGATMASGASANTATQVNRPSGLAGGAIAAILLAIGFGTLIKRRRKSRR